MQEIVITKNFIKAKMLKRYKRFFADLTLDGELITAHVPNTGSLKSCLFPDQLAFITPAENPERKLKFTLQALETPTGIVGVNTQIPNQMVKMAVEAQFLAHWKNYDLVKPEFKLNAETRIDFMLENSLTHKRHFIEVKNVSLKENKVALFPDAETIRGQKHLKELMGLTKQGHSCEILFFIQRQDVSAFAAAKEIDPEYARLLFEANSHQVKITPIICEVCEQGYKLTHKLLPIHW